MHCRFHTSGNDATPAPDSYANPHAPTAFFDGVATTTYSYDNNGNLIGSTGAATSTLIWDYRNRMLSAWVSAATSTYQYDHTIARMAQITPTTTTHYPSKFYSIEYQGVGTTTATSTAYIWHGDTLVAYIQQVIADGAATGTPTTYFTHPDHLGSTNVVTDESGDVVQALDYYPYGAERIHSGSADADRTFIGQFGDDATELSYLNARYYDPARGQFLSQDPVFLAIGHANKVREYTNQEQNNLLSDPQLLHGYGYARNNPVINKDPTGLISTNTFFRGLDIISNIMFARTTGDYFIRNPSETPQDLANDSAQFYADGTMFVAGLAAGSLSPAGIALNTGGLTLYGLDKYCGGHTCRNFDPGERTPEETARAVLSGDTKYLPTRTTNVEPNNTPKLTLQQTFTQQFTSARQSVSAQISSIQSQINSIRAQLNTLIKQRSSGQSKSAP